MRMLIYIVIYSSFQGMNAQSKLYINVASIQPLIQDKSSKLVWVKFTIDSHNPFSLHFNSSFNNNFSIDLRGIENKSNHPVYQQQMIHIHIQHVQHNNHQQ